MADTHPDPLSCCVVDDDPVILELASELLRRDGFRVRAFESAPTALQAIAAEPPAFVLLDIMMPEMDGLEACKRLRELEQLRATKIIIHSSKSYEFDRNRAFQFGADGYLLKPINAARFTQQVREFLDQGVVLDFWGTRGTLPCPGQGSVRYGGNTSCVSLTFPRERLFVFDAGSGIKALSDHLMASGKRPLRGKIFISHPHWDHINALPFFVPLYLTGNEFEICGPAQGDLTMRELISAQMDSVYFPITIKEFGARVYFQDLREGSYTMDGIQVRTLLLNHPGYCLGYRIDYHDRSVCYVTDNELFFPDTPGYSEHYLKNLTAFVQGADALITDCTYFDEEYRSKVGWGHSCLSQVAALAHQAQVKNLYLFHHDPDHSDTDIDRKLCVTQELLADMHATTACVAPAEGDRITL